MWLEISEVCLRLMYFMLITISMDFMMTTESSMKDGNLQCLLKAMY